MLPSGQLAEYMVTHSRSAQGQVNDKLQQILFKESSSRSHQSEELTEIDESWKVESNMDPHDQIHEHLSNTNYTHWVIK